MWFLFVLFLQGLFAFEIGIVAFFKDEAPYLKEWIEYHKLIGVDYFLLYNNQSQDHWEEVLAPYRESGLVEVLSWPDELIYADRRAKWGDFLSQQVHVPTWLPEMHKDALRYVEGKGKWLAFIQTFQFILPHYGSTLQECLDQCFRQDTGAVYMYRKIFGSQGIYLTPGQPMLPHFTSCSEPFYPGSSLVRIDRVDIEKTKHPDAFPLKNGWRYYDSFGYPICHDTVAIQADTSK